MNRASKPLALLLATSLLSGCAAVAIPAVVGGVMAGKAARGKRTASPAPVPTAAPAAKPARGRPSKSRIRATPADTPPPPRPAPKPRPVPPTPPPPPSPSRETPAVPPRPVVASAPEVRAAAPATPTPQPANAPVGTAGWAEVVRFVAGHRAGERSVLFAPGEERPTACSGKPPAVLAPLSLALTGPSQSVGTDERLWLDALNTIGVTTVFVATDASQAGVARAAFNKAKLPAPVQGQTLFVGTSLAGVRASVSARFCVLAIAGRGADDFPGGRLPDMTPPALSSLWGQGWFLFAPPAR